MSNPSQFSFLSNKQYLLWKLKAKILYSIEVTEVEIAVSGGRRRGQGPGEKKVWSKILKSAIFELHKRYTPQKKDENNRHLDLK